VKESTAPDDGTAKMNGIPGRGPAYAGLDVARVLEGPLVQMEGVFPTATREERG